VKQAISAFLFSALVVTGGISVAVFAMPDLVIIGFFFLILPGVILTFAPSVFLYLMTFSLPWFLLNHRGILAGILGGLVAIGGVGYVLPAMLNQETNRRLFQAKVKEMAPTSKVASARIVALQSLPYFSTQGCSDLCQTLLYNGAAERVVLLPGKNAGGGFLQYKSFRTERMSSCPVSEPKLLSEWTGDWFRGRDGSTIAQTVRLRISGGECLIMETEWNGVPDLVLQRVQESFGEKVDWLTLASGEVNATGLQLMAGGKVLARQTQRVPRRLTIPLLLNPRSSGMSISGWEWSRHGEYHEPTDPRPFLQRFTELNVAPPLGLDNELVRKRIDAALKDPSIPATDGAFGLVKDYFDGLPREHVEEEDVQRIARLVKDARVTQLDFPGYKVEPAQIRDLQGPILDRLLKLGAAEDWKHYYQLSQVLRWAPEGAFQRADPRVDQLLSTPALRRNAPVLVKRLADRGGTEAQRIFSFLLENYAPSEKQEERRIELADAALKGLCRLGPEARAVLPGLRQAAAAGTIPLGKQDSDIWRATLVSVGASVNDFDLPKNRQWSTGLYRKSLRKLADNGCEDR
jgi:hypothetical protein